MEKFRFSVPTKVIFGENVAQSVGPEIVTILKRSNLKVMIITDKGVNNAGLTKEIEKSLMETNLEYVLYDDIDSNPKDTAVDATAEIFQYEKADVIVAIGGGSVIDAAKAIGVVAANGGSISDYDGWDLVPKAIPPLFAIPTTAGTASEVTIWAVISDSKAKVKMGIGDYKICPTVAMVDPAMTYSLPYGLTVGTGLDALTHAVEAYTSKVANPVSDVLALKAIKLIMKNLPEVANNGKNKEARKGMMLGSLIAGMAFSNSNVAAVHCLSETFGGYYNGPHGMLNGIFLPYVMAFNLIEIPERFSDIANAMGAGSSPTAAVEAVANLEASLEIPKLVDLCACKEDIEELGRLSASHPCNADNPREMAAKDYSQIIENVLEGKSAI